MNIQEYISSGVLESYAIGELSAQERAEVERNLLQHPALGEELRKIEEAQEEFLTRAAVQPRALVKEKLFRNLDAKEINTTVGTVHVLGSSGHLWKYAAAASVTLALVAGYLAYDYRSKWQLSERSLNELVAQNQQIVQNYNTVNQRMDKLQSDLKISNNPSFTRIVLKGTATAPNAMASVLWNPQTKEVYLSIQNLKTLAQENQYQLWAIVDGQPVDAGVFDASSANGLLAMKTMEGASAFAITIEPRGGRPSPTLETMQVFGQVSG